MKAASLVFFNLLYAVQCSKILMVFPMPSTSHFILGNALGRGLVKAGHKVTMVSSFEDKDPPHNYTNVVLTGLMDKKIASGFNAFDLGSRYTIVVSSIVSNSMGIELTKNALSHPNFQKLINSGEIFDVIVLQNFKNDGMNALQCLFKAPLIIFSVYGPNFWVNPFVGTPLIPSFVRDFSFSSKTNHMDFWERTHNSLILFANYAAKYLYFIPEQKKLMTRYFPTCKDQTALLNNVSLVLVPSHEIFNQPIPLVPNMINIGGFHIQPSKELPKYLKEFMDDAEEGVVYFSLGTNVDITLMPNETRRSILNSLGKLQQKVLIKYNGELPDAPKNIKFGNWFPQSDILAHHNIKLFISHGGLLSTLETVYHGVPVLALPVFADQNLNGGRIQAEGYGLTIPFSEITEENLNCAINELLNNETYRKNVIRRSILFRDRPIKPMDLAIYWIEFVIRHKGAPHLRFSGHDLEWYQYFILDVIAFMLFVSISTIAVLYLICNRIFCSRYKKLKIN